MNNIKAIETVYNGYRFRSRLEARWAIFFDAVGAKWEYEPEGFDIPTKNGIVKYLPDFRISNYHGRGADKNGQLYVEVKGGKMSEEDAEKVDEFSRFHPILVVGNIPKEDWKDDIGNRCWDEFTVSKKHFVYEFNFATMDGDYFGAFLAASDKGGITLMGADTSYFYGYDEYKTAEAYNLARQARFEHGERGF